eukprot:3316991-Rhodomonas_salina.1
MDSRIPGSPGGTRVPGWVPGYAGSASESPTSRVPIPHRAELVPRYVKDNISVHLHRTLNSTRNKNVVPAVLVTWELVTVTQLSSTKT